MFCITLHCMPDLPLMKIFFGIWPWCDLFSWFKLFPKYNQFICWLQWQRLWIDKQTSRRAQRYKNTAAESWNWAYTASYNESLKRYTLSASARQRAGEYRPLDLRGPDDRQMALLRRELERDWAWGWGRGTLGSGDWWKIWETSMKYYSVCLLP